MLVGFAKNDITPHVGIELCGFGPFLCRRSIAIRDRLWARAMAVEHNEKRMIIVSCDLIGTTLEITNRVRAMVSRHTGLPKDALMVVSSHTHSGPNSGPYIGWGQPDAVYLETLPSRIANACIHALENMQEAELSHTEAPCEGIALNREHEQETQPLMRVLQDDWRPAKPELTDTTCHVITAKVGDKLIGFISYFGCHPVVCCAQTRHIHGDYCGIATNMLEREHVGTVGLFLQGAQGDVNTCVAHKPEQESLLALDVIASRYANAVRGGIQQATPLQVDRIAYYRSKITFSWKDYPLKQLRGMLAERESRLHALDADDSVVEESRETYMDTVWAIALRRLIARIKSGQSPVDPTEVHGIRIGPITILGSGFETFQAIKNDVVEKAAGPITLVTSLANDSVGYAPSHAAVERGGYAADFAPFIVGTLPYANIHKELVEALLSVDKKLR